MYLPSLLLLPPLLLLGPVSAAPLEHPQRPLSSDASRSGPAGRTAVPTRDDSAVLARRLLALSTTGVLSTVFPPLSPAGGEEQEQEDRPASVARTPIGLPDYFAACEPAGDPTVLSLDVSTAARNAAAGSNVSLAVAWWGRARTWSEASLPRAALLGYLEDLTEDELRDGRVEECFVRRHGDARLWLPGAGSSPHAGRWQRLNVQEIYWVGGFGDVAYIGWLDPTVFKNVTEEEWSKVRLPGEV